MCPKWKVTDIYILQDVDVLRAYVAELRGMALITRYPAPSAVWFHATQFNDRYTHPFVHFFSSVVASLGTVSSYPLAYIEMTDESLRGL